MANSFEGAYSNSVYGTSKYSNIGVSKNADLNDPNILLELAKNQGGAVAQAANEIAHPTTGILSTIGEGFKKTFRGFVDVISMPGQAVAGVLSSKYSIGEAIKKDISVSDVWFGKPDPKNSTLEKIGSFTVRTAVDILTDPLTYLTFGASGVGKGSIFGIGAIKKVMVGEDAAKAIGGSVAKKFADTGIAEVALNQAGFDVNKYATLLMAQQSGKAIEKTVVNELTGKIEKVLSRSQIGELDNELKMLMKVSLDSDIDVDYAAMAVGKLIEKFPQLTETLLDKGGIKFFGNTILESQRIYQTTQLIPGMSMIDHATRPMRQVLSSMFNPAAQKMADGSIAVIPDELVRMRRSLEELSETTGDARITQLWNIVKENKLSLEDAKLITASIEANKVMKEPRLENVRKLIQGFSDNEIKFLQESGIPISKLENYFPHILTPEAVAASNKVGFARGGLTQSVPSAEQRNVLKFINTNTGEVKVSMAKKLNLVETAFDDIPLSILEGSNMEELFFKSSDTGDIFKAVQATVSEAKAAGFDFEDNAILAYAAKSIQNVRSGFSYQYMNAAAHRFGVSKENAGKGWRTVNLSGIEKMGHRMDALLGKKFEERYFPPAIATFLEDTISKSLSDPGSKSFLAAYDKIQNYWKASVTSIWPAFNGMNAISNVLQNFLDIGLHALDPVLNTQASAMIYTDRKVFNLERKAMKEGAEGLAAREEMNKILLAPMFTDNTGITWTYGELRQLMQRKGIAFDPNHITGQLDVTTTGRIEKLFDSQDPFIKKAWKEANLFSMDNRIFKTGRHVSQMVEEQARVTNFVANLRATGDPFLAAQRTKMFLFDYGNLTNFEKTFLKRIMPFYTFTRKNLELQVRTLLTTPGRIEAELTGIQNLGDILSGDKKLTEEERAALPEWARYGINVLRDRRNSTVSMYTTLKTPIEQIFAQFQPNTLLGSISPLMRVPLEQLSGYSLYNGKMLSDVTNAAAFKRAPESVKRFIGYTEIKGTYKDGTPFVWYESLRPERMNLLLNLPPTTRVFSSLKQMDAVDVSEQDKILQQLTGIKPFTFDLAKEQAKRDKELAAKLTKLLDNANVVATFSKTYIPKESGY